MALLFTSASSQHLTIVQDSAMDSTTQITGMLWVNFTNLTPNPSNLMAWSVGPPPGTSSTSRFSMQVNNAGGIIFIAKSTDAEGSQTTTSANGTITAGTLYHIACVVDFTAKTEDIYVNGTKNIGSTGLGFAANSTPATDSKSASFNSEDDGSSGFSNVTMADGRIYNRSLSANEIKTIYACMGNDGIINGMVRNWSFSDQAPGTTATTNLIDLVTRKALPPINSPTYASFPIKSRRKAM